ncbi:MAG: sensor histidine kinase [Clostridiales bacterium]|jgi:two-component system sensor histidine kinase YesM|nr:sensor histidine kinase [Clostridiales bacterium]
MKMGKSRKKALRTVKSRVIAMMVSFALVIAALVSAFSYYLIETFQRSIAIQSAEFDLQLVNNLISQDLSDMYALARWCGTCKQVGDYFRAQSYSAGLSVAAYDRVLEELLNNRSYKYVQRLIIVDENRQRILQLGVFPTSSTPLNRYSLNMLLEVAKDVQLKPSGIIRDPYLFDPSFLMPLACEVHDPVDFSEIGRVYLMASTKLITDKLLAYSLPEGSSLYISMGRASYRIEGETLIPSEHPGEENAVSLAAPNGLTLSQTLPNAATSPLASGFLSLLAFVVVMIAITTILIMRSMNKSISLPVSRLHRKVNEIAEGDLSFEPSIESDDEIGEVGRGVNNLSSKVLELVESRLADEQHKRDLEYRMLQSQIHPHFLYNTLNSLKWMAVMQKADGIAEMITALSRLLKSSSKDLRKVVPLREELAVLENYFIIQRYRYGGTVIYEVDVESDDLLGAMIPRFALQPLVENAIFHGVEPQGAGKVALKVSRNAEDVLIEIEDDGVGMSEEEIAKVFAPIDEGEEASNGHIGILNVHERIQHVFGTQYGLSIESAPGRYTIVNVRMPFRS